jgi:cytosine deaminase
VVSLPHTNLCLQDRAPGRTPRRRGLTLVQELAAAGVPVSFASDNVQDAFHPFGDHDLLEVAGSAIRAAQLDADIAPWLAAVTLRPSAAMGLAGGRLAAGGAADFTLFSARDPYALFSLPQQNRIVVRAGLVAAKPLTEAVA